MNIIYFFYKLLSKNTYSTKRFIALIGTIGIIIYTFISNDPTPLLTIVLTCIGGNVIDGIYGKERIIEDKPKPDDK